MNVHHKRRAVLKPLLELLSLVAFLLGSPLYLQRQPESQVQPATSKTATQTADRLG
jgi:hypothetical protein